MLHHTFVHVPSVGAKTEEKIWQAGVLTIHDFIARPPADISKKKALSICQELYSTVDMLADGNASYFAGRLPSAESWRIYSEFRHSIAYVDIETTGMEPFNSHITTIALYDGSQVKHYVHGDNLQDFPRDIQQYKLLVTYNGKCFDVPFIESYFGIQLNHAHIDLRYVLASLGFTGGLKSCERQFGIGRTGSVAEVDGYFAVLLWREYKKTKKMRYLETLLSYNIEDVLSLEILMAEAYNRKIAALPFADESVDIPPGIQNPFSVDSATVESVQKKYGIIMF